MGPGLCREETEIADWNNGRLQRHCCGAPAPLAACPIFCHIGAMPEPVIFVENLVKRYGATLAVDGISFAVERGVTTALLGGNGAGKTTTLSILLGLLLPTSGSVRIFNEDVLHHLAVRENVVISPRLYGPPQRDGRIAALAQDLEIEARLERPAGKLSSGQKTRVALAKALLNEPELLLLDEPTVSLDPDTGDWVRGYLEDYRARTGATIMLASHNMAEVERLCSEVLMMRAGRIVDRGSPEELIDRYGRTNLEEVFLQIARGVRAVLEPAL